MNDSFLDELEIVHSEALPSLGQRQAEQYITTRRSRSTGQSNNLVPLNEGQENIDVNTNANSNSLANPRERKPSELIKEPKKHAVREQENKLLQSRVLERKAKAPESKVKSLEAGRAKADERAKNDSKNKCSENKDVKASKEQNRRSGSSNPSSRRSDPTKENNVLPDLAGAHGNPTPGRSSGPRKIEVKDPLGLLNAIKELVSSYSKQESSRILRAMQELHINSQSTMIKHMLIQTEDLTKEIHPSRDTSRLRKLVEENERMREDIVILRLRSEELQRKVDESILIREENVALKLKLKELLKSS
ncbi:uncharacterized protein LOC117183119 [Belonocnema kinseyi]|uniref:uncharacterized protein LOC117183119 n=1 Tax=Belonocnema kinseyi TaxID=2817044 RepID=UPI00143D5081|nr:uncharacterized protein LOC117183119 [Belonocnema kinseyi]